MTGKEVILNIDKDHKPFKRVLFLMKTYNDLKRGTNIMNEVQREVTNILDEAFELVRDDEYFDIIEMYCFKGCTMEQTALELNMDRSTAYRQRTRIAHRLALILYGDEALI